MMKSESDIERDFYQSVSASELGGEIDGKVYRPGMRPDNSKKEDIVVKFLTGVDGQTQEGEVIVNVYVPDVPNKGKLVKAHARIAELEAKIPQLIEKCKGTDYHIRTNGTSKTMQVEEIHQHCICIRLLFKCLTD